MAIRPQFFPVHCFTALLSSLPLAAQQRELPADRRGGASTVDVAQCRQWLSTLAGPEFEGRATGQPGYRKAADYVAAHFAKLGLTARGADGSWFQHVPWATVEVQSATLRFTADGEERLVVPIERLSGSTSIGLQATGEVLLLHVVLPPAEAGAGNRTAAPLPDLGGVEIAGKVIVACISGGDARRSAAAMTRFAVLQALQGKSAAAVVFATPEAVAGGLRGRAGGGRRGGNPAAAAAQRAPLDLTFGGGDFAAFAAACGLDPQRLPASSMVQPTPLRCTLEIVAAEGDAPAMNVFAVLPGSDPKLRDEYVVIGSHLDHLGKAGDTIRPGADDDASGTTGVMAIAQMFARNPQRPKRSILFVCFSGEENGLVGSRYFVDNCPVPLGAIVAELQLDMIGRDEEEAMDGGRRINVGETAEQNRNSLHLVGTARLSPALHELCVARNERAGFDLEWDHEDMFDRSDHANFAQKGIPIAFFFTGLHRDYHQPTDTPDKIHYEKLLRVARYVYDIAFELADARTRPTVDPDLWQQFRARSRGRAPETPVAPLGGAKTR